MDSTCELFFCSAFDAFPSGKIGRSSIWRDAMHKIRYQTPYHTTHIRHRLVSNLIQRLSQPRLPARSTESLPTLNLPKCGWRTTRQREVTAIGLYQRGSVLEGHDSVRPAPPMDRPHSCTAVHAVSAVDEESPWCQAVASRRPIQRSIQGQYLCHSWFESSVQLAVLFMVSMWRIG